VHWQKRCIHCQQRFANRCTLVAESSFYDSLWYHYCIADALIIIVHYQMCTSRTSERDNKGAKNKDCQGLQCSNRPFSYRNWQFRRYLKAVKSSVAHFLSNEYSQYSAELNRLPVTGRWNFGRSHAIIPPLLHAVLNTQGWCTNYLLSSGVLSQ
jgi:hypothetical protein